MLLLDQLTKHWAVNALSDGRVVDVVGSLRWNLAFNRGMAFSQGEGLGPIIGVVARTDLNLIGQLVPGQTVRFTWIDRAEAVTLAAAQHAALATLARTVQAAFRACLMTAN